MDARLPCEVGQPEFNGRWELVAHRRQSGGFRRGRQAAEGNGYPPAADPRKAVDLG